MHPSERFRVFVDLALTPESLARLLAGTEGHELVFPAKPVASVLAQGEPDPRFAEVEVAFGQPAVEAIRNAPNLRWIQISSSGITRYDTPEFRRWLSERGIQMTNSARVYADACADHALSFLLGQSRNLPRSLALRTPNGSGAWHELRGSCVPLRGQSLLILGFGTIGRRLVELLRPYEMEVRAYRRQPRGDEGIPVVDPTQLRLALQTADHVVNILPDSSETRKFCNGPIFAAMKTGAAFYNIGRGTTVDQEALTAALRSGQVGAAWLDVTDPEPLPESHPLWLEPNCFITPHVAGGHQDEQGTLVRHFVDNFHRFVREEPLLDLVSV